MGEIFVGLLDDIDEIKRHDRDGMLTILDHFDRQLEEAVRIGLEADISTVKGNVQNILVCGLGGSAIGADFLRAYLGSDLTIPFFVNRNYSIPPFAGPSTLAVICSYSGNTEETLSAFEQAQKAGCQIICLTSGGRLEKLARDHKYPCLRIPGGLPPRTALGYSSIPVLVVFSRVGLVEDRCGEIRRSLDFARGRLLAYGPQSPLNKNPAKRLATQIHGKIPVVYGSAERLEMVAVRWRGQFSENGKQLAYSSTLPEMNHNEIVGWKHPAPVLRQIVPIFLRDRDDHSRVKIRIDITRELIAARAGTSLEYSSEGEGWLERLWSLILLGDFASVYLAFLNEENPTPVQVIEDLKNRLKQYEG